MIEPPALILIRQRCRLGRKGAVSCHVKGEMITALRQPFETGGTATYFTPDQRQGRLVAGASIRYT